MASPVRLALIAAVARNGVIGAGGELPWRLSADLAHFRKRTLGCPLIMGRKTWQSLPRRPLLGRANLVVSRRSDVIADGAEIYPDPQSALLRATAIAGAANAAEIFVMGGASLFAQTLEQADRLYLTEVAAEPLGDVFFPPWDRSRWRETERLQLLADAANDHDFVIRTLVRLRATEDLVVDAGAAEV